MSKSDRKIRQSLKKEVSKTQVRWIRAIISLTVLAVVGYWIYPHLPHKKPERPSFFTLDNVQKTK